MFRRTGWSYRLESTGNAPNRLPKLRTRVRFPSSAPRNTQVERVLVVEHSFVLPDLYPARTPTLRAVLDVGVFSGLDDLLEHFPDRAPDVRVQHRCVSRHGGCTDRCQAATPLSVTSISCHPGEPTCAISPLRSGHRRCRATDKLTKDNGCPSSMYPFLGHFSCGIRWFGNRYFDQAGLGPGDPRPIRLLYPLFGE
jgi:hypothetical protein